MRDTEINGRLLLALLLAFGLHAALLFGVPAEWWTFRHPRPSRFEVVLLPPVPVPAEPVERTPAPELSTPSVAGLPETASTPEPSTPPVAGLPQPAVSTETRLSSPSEPATTDPSPPVSISQPAPESVEPAAPARPAVRVKPPASSVAAKSAPLPVHSPKSRPVQPPKPARSIVEKPPVEPIRTPQRPAVKPAAREPTRSARASERPPVSGGSGARDPLDSAALLGQIASLDMEIQQRANAGVRSKRISLADTRSAAGFYAADWARKVTRVGEMNFPDAARRLNLSTGPLLDVAIRADGSVREVRILRSSGNSEIDRAARRIVELAAPYPPFPAELRQQVDVLRIESPWRFDPGGTVRAR